MATILEFFTCLYINNGQEILILLVVDLKAVNYPANYGGLY